MLYFTKLINIKPIMTSRLNCTEPTIYTYSEAINDENLPLESVMLSDGSIAVNIFKLYLEGSYTSSNIESSGAGFISQNNNGPIYSCSLTVRSNFLVEIGALNSTSNETIPFNNIVLTRINENIYNGLSMSDRNSLHCSPYNGDISTLPHYPHANFPFSFVRNILLNNTNIDLTQLPCQTTTMILPTSTMELSSSATATQSEFLTLIPEPTTTVKIKTTIASNMPEISSVIAESASDTLISAIDTTTIPAMTTTLASIPEETNVISDNIIDTNIKISSNNSSDAAIIIGSIITFIFVITLTVISALFLFKFDKNTALKIKSKIGRIFRIKNNRIEPIDNEGESIVNAEDSAV